MIELRPRNSGAVARIGGQPIAIAAVAFVIVVMGIGSIALWRAPIPGNAPRKRIASSRQGNCRPAPHKRPSNWSKRPRAWKRPSSSESIDQLQVVQDQLVTVRRLLASQQTDTKKLSEQGGRAD